MGGQMRQGAGPLRDSSLRQQSESAPCLPSAAPCMSACTHVPQRCMHAIVLTPKHALKVPYVRVMPACLPGMRGVQVRAIVSEASRTTADAAAMASAGVSGGGGSSALMGGGSSGSGGRQQEELLETLVRDAAAQQDDSFDMR